MIFDKYSDENRHFVCHIPCLSLHHTKVVLLMYCRCRHQVALSFLSARANFNCDVIITLVAHFAQSLALPVPPLPSIGANYDCVCCVFCRYLMSALYIGLSGSRRTISGWRIIFTSIRETNLISLLPIISQHYSASVSLALPLVLNMCYESSQVAQRLCLSKSRPARIMSLLRYPRLLETLSEIVLNPEWSNYSHIYIT